MSLVEVKIPQEGEVLAYCSEKKRLVNKPLSSVYQEKTFEVQDQKSRDAIVDLLQAIDELKEEIEGLKQKQSNLIVIYEDERTEQEK